MLVRHIAGVPSATEQRCVRCCEVIAAATLGTNFPQWPGGPAYTTVKSDVASVGEPWQDCKPVDLSTREVELREATIPATLDWSETR